jgi:hypothetical protein
MTDVTSERGNFHEASRCRRLREDRHRRAHKEKGSFAKPAPMTWPRRLSAG